MHGPSRFGKSRSFLGEELDVECKGWDSIYGGRECLNVLRHLRTLPVVDEQYFEWHSILQAAFDAAEHGQMLMVADVGSGLDAMWFAPFRGGLPSSHAGVAVCDAAWRRRFVIL